MAILRLLRRYISIFKNRIKCYGVKIKVRIKKLEEENEVERINADMMEVMMQCINDEYTTVKDLIERRISNAQCDYHKKIS